MRWEGLSRGVRKSNLGVDRISLAALLTTCWRRTKVKVERSVRRPPGEGWGWLGDLEDGEKWLDFKYTLKVELMALLIAQMWGRRGNPLPPPLNGVPSSQGQACYMWGVVDHDTTRGIDRHLPTFRSSATNGLDSIFHFETIFEFITICSIQWVCRLPSASCRRSSGRDSWDRISQCVPQCGGGPWCLAKEFLVIHSNGCYHIRFWKSNFLFNPVLLHIKRQSPLGGKS